MTAPLVELLEALIDTDVEFILVGGMAAVVHGAPVATVDLDIVHKRSPENLERVMAFLDSLNSFYRGQPRRRKLKPSREGLSGTGHNNFTTSLGPLDLLGELQPGQGYEQLYPFSEPIRMGRRTFRVIGLKKLIELKNETGRAKDDLMLPILLALLKE